MINAASIAATFCLAACVFSLPARAADPVIDNERVTVWDTNAALPPAQHDFIAVPLTAKERALLEKILREQQS